jgi:hypothetical protein
MHRHDTSLAKLDAATIVAASRGAEILIVQALRAADVREAAEARPATDRPVETPPTRTASSQQACEPEE